MNEGFGTSMSAEIRVPQEGFTLDDLKAHMKSTKVPLDARLVPAIVRDVTTYSDEPTTSEVRLRAEWAT